MNKAPKTLEEHQASFDRIERLAGALHCEPRLLLSPTPPRYEYAVVKLP